MSFYLLPPEILCLIAGYLPLIDVVTMTTINKRCYHVFNESLLEDYQKQEWSCTLWINKAQAPVIGIIYPKGDYQRSKEYLNIKPTITTPGQFIYTNNNQLDECSFQIGSRPHLFKAKNRCYLHINRKRATYQIENITIERRKIPKITYLQDALIIFPKI